MYATLPAEMRKGRIHITEKANIPEGTRLLVTIVPEDDGTFWAAASKSSCDAVWDNKDDDIYEELLHK
jgi:hypothetical protein